MIKPPIQYCKNKILHKNDQPSAAMRNKWMPYIPDIPYRHKNVSNEAFQEMKNINLNESSSHITDDNEENS